MSKDILSLKNLYRFLFDCDYPIFSMGIIEKKYHVGMTITKFWQDMILSEFRNTKNGRIIWRNEGGRNKYTSEILNRSGARSIYVKYAEELVYIISQELIFKQIEAFKDFLVESNYNYKVFMTKLSAYLTILSRDDEMFSSDLQVFFQTAMNQRTEAEAHGTIEQAYLCGWFLTFLMIYSFAGNEDSYEHLRRLCHSKRFMLENLVKTYFDKEYARKQSDKYLTEKNAEVCSAPLERRHYFGREEALFDLHEMRSKGGKYLISGIGGAGKTELLRQFVADCEKEDLVDYFCVIQYEDNFEDSIVKAFSKARGKNKGENLTEALATIRLHEKDKVVILVDNVDHSVEEDEGLKLLLDIPGTVFITSRYQRLTGFETYRLEAVEKTAGALIFRDNCQYSLAREDRKFLEELLQNEAWRHTLTLRLLSKVAGTKNWSLQELIQYLNKGDKVLLQEGMSSQDELGKLYGRMYAMAGFSEEWHTFLRIFARLPYKGYSLDFVEKYMRTLIPDIYALENMLEVFWSCGWLERRANEYSMQPFIAESLSVQTLSWEEFRPFLDCIIEGWLQVFEEGPDANLENICYGVDSTWNTQLQELTIVAGRMLKDFEAYLDNKYLQLLLLSFHLERSVYGMVLGQKEFLFRLKQRANEFPDNIRCFIYMLCANLMSEEELRVLYQETEAMSEVAEGVRSIFVLQYLENMEKYGKLDGMEELIDMHRARSNNVSIILQFTLFRACVHLLAGRWEPYEAYMREAVEMGYAHGMAHTKLLGETRDALSCLYVGLGRFDDAERLLEEQDKYLKGRETLYFHWSKLYCWGYLKFFRGDQQYGVPELEEARRVGQAVAASGENNRINANSLYGELAMAYNKAGRREEAEECYQKVLEFFVQYPDQKLLLYRTYNNMGVMYLDWEKYAQAEACFEKAYEGGKSLGGLPMAEPANNLSKIYRKQGNREKELEYLKIALPIMEHYYGSEHNKVVEAKERMNG